MRERKSLFFSVLIFLLISLNTYGSKGHVNLNLKNQGLKKVLTEVVRHYQKKDSHSVYIIPSATIDGKIGKEEIQSNPIIKALSDQYLNFDVNKDLTFKVNWSDIRVEAQIDEDSLEIHSEGRDGLINLAVKTDFKKINISGDYIEICEFYNDAGTCDENKGLYGRFNDFSLALDENTPLNSLIETSVRVSRDWIELNFKRMMTNIFSTTSKLDMSYRSKYQISNESPSFDLTFKDFTMPPPILVVNGKKFIINVDHIEQVMRDKREFLSKHLVSAAGKFVAKDLVRILNEKIIKKLGAISKHFKLIDYNKHETYKDKFLELSKSNPRAAVEYMLNYGVDQKESSLMDSIKNIFSRVIYTAENDLSLDTISTEKKKDIHLSFNNVLRLNQNNVKIHNKLWNGLKEYKPISFESHEMKDQYEVAFGISEPLINSIINSGVRTGVLDRVLQKVIDKKGVSISELNLHFINNGQSCSLTKVKAVAMLNIRLSKLKREGLVDHITYKVGELIESDWSINGLIPIPKPVERVLVLPIEFDLTFAVNNRDDQTVLSLAVDPYLVNNEFSNSFSYPEMNLSHTVKSSIHKQVLEGLVGIQGEIFDINISDHIQKIPGFKLKLKDLIISDNGHLVFALDIKDIKLDELREIIGE